LISFSILFSIFLTTLLIKLLTLVFAFRSQQNQEKMQGLQLKINEIQNRYKYSSEPNARQKMQMEIMGLYRSENINPLSSFLSVMLTFPFLYAMFIVIRANRLLKESRVGKIELIEQP
jgi:YidC/Oxa1 family membrane protein insertase